MLIRAFRDFVKYKDYLIHNVRVNLKLKVSNTILGYFWWLLDPLLQMLVYTIIVDFIFKRGSEGFPIFVFCGLLSWKWLSSTLMYSASCIKSNSGILNQVYLPKFIIPLQECIINLFKFLFGFIVLLVMLIVFRIAPSFHFVELVVVVAANMIFVFALSLIFTHYGVFVNDIKNLLSHFNRIWWYLSPGIYSLSIIPGKYHWLFWLNPNTAFFESYRNVIMYKHSPYYWPLLIWTAIGLFLIYFGLTKLYKYDRMYSKII